MSSGHLFCTDRNGMENVTIMMSLFDEEQIMKTYVKDMQKEAAKETAKETAKRLFKKGMSLDDIADCSPQLSMDELREIEAEVTALV